MDQRPTISNHELAELLGMKPETFQRKRHKLLEEGMPKPIPGLDLVWSRRNVLAWIDGELAPAGDAEPGR